MTTDDEFLLKIAAIGALVAAGKLLAGNEALSLRKVIGRTILGSASSVAACALLVEHPGLSELALTGLSTLFGILGSAFVESLAIKYLDKKLGKKDD